MAKRMLESGTLSTYCESIAVMLSAGIQTDEAVSLFADNMTDARLKKVCDSIYEGLIGGNPLSVSMAKTGVFPRYALDMIAAGEFSGHLENTLVSLSSYYSEESRLAAKVKSAIAYPATLLIIMAAILAFIVSIILPVFVDVYKGFSGDLTAGSYSYIQASIVIGWVALAIILICTAVMIIAIVMSRSSSGRIKLLNILEKTPITKEPLRQLAVGRFTSALVTYVASGIASDTAMKEATAMVTHKGLKKQLEGAYQEMIDPETMKSLAQTIYDNDIFESIYARVLVVGSQSGSLEAILLSLSNSFFEDSIRKIDNLIDSVEPALAGFLTISVGATLIAVMLPLIGIMGSIG